MESIDILRGRFLRIKRANKLEYAMIAEALGLSSPTILRFVHGTPVNEKTLLAIEAWCDAQEAARRNAKEGH
jgi:hypothetical protein